YSKPGNTLGHGIGADIGVAWVSGPIEIGFGVNDIGATITWPDTRLDSAFYNDSGYSKPVANHVETKTKLPVSYIANLAYSVGNTTLGADVLNTGRGSVVHVGGEQRLGLFAVRGGVARDQRKRIEVGFGGGDRKSTRLNSSHLGISYAVFCLKKKSVYARQYPVRAHEGRV